MIFRQFHQSIRNYNYKSVRIVNSSNNESKMQTEITCSSKVTNNVNPKQDSFTIDDNEKSYFEHHDRDKF